MGIAESAEDMRRSAEGAQRPLMVRDSAHSASVHSAILRFLR